MILVHGARVFFLRVSLPFLLSFFSFLATICYVESRLRAVWFVDELRYSSNAWVCIFDLDLF